jgi:hypothetical protein
MTFAGWFDLHPDKNGIQPYFIMQQLCYEEQYHRKLDILKTQT